MLHHVLSHSKIRLAGADHSSSKHTSGIKKKGSYRTIVSVLCHHTSFVALLSSFEYVMFPNFDVTKNDSNVKRRKVAKH